MATFAIVRIAILLPAIILTTFATATARPWSDEVMYFMITDRFFDADSSNNNPPGCDHALFDSTQNDIARYMGGDLRGVEVALQNGYFNDLGVTSLWLTPVVRNVWRSGYDLGGWKTGYHGYWTQDWLDIDPHLVSKTSLSGQPYTDDANGRMEHYRDFVKLAHTKGIRVIQDVVLNHAGPVFYYDTNHNNTFDKDLKDEWVQPFKRDGFYETAKWANIPQWNAVRTMPDGPRNLLGKTIHTQGILSSLNTYGRKGFSDDSLGKSDGEEIQCDFFSLRDLWTARDGKYFDQLVDEFVEIYQFYLTTVGVDGLRIDTIKHVHHEFWDAFTQRLRKRLGPSAADKLIFGEIYDGNPEVLGRYTWRSDWPSCKDPALDSVLDFNTCFAARDYLRKPDAGFGSPAALGKALLSRTAMATNGRPYFNPNPSADGLNSQQKIITFIENHDGLNRFRVAGITAQRNRLAQALLLTLPGIPCLYYGTETDLLDSAGKLGEDGETGRMMLFRHHGGLSMTAAKTCSTFSTVAELSALRRRLPVLRTGALVPLWGTDETSATNNGVLAFARASTDGDALAVIAINLSTTTAMTAGSDHAMQLPSTLKTAGKQLRPVFSTGHCDPTAVLDASGPLRVAIPPSTLVVYEIVTANPRGK